ncbi:MAG TPA: PKD domain-containing protein, partial [Candidatus Deferrimicrobium sp.]|nr:PKD domain-containing protein [Candidatus Deferrimicrobium sp.]
GEDYGGGGVWKYAGDQAVVENNTIVGNASTTSGGGVLLWSSSMMLRNNVIWGNTAPSGPQINGPATVMYCDVQGGYTGTGNINQTPLLFGDYLYLQASSPAIDVGDPSLVYNDVENPAYVGSARWPALGGLRSDMGAYGGAGGFSFDPGAIYADTTIGWAPLAVNFQGFSRDAADAMTWDFGDGAVDTGTTPAHTYFLGGLYNVSLTVDTGAGTVVINEPDFIAALADTMIAADVVGSRNTTVEVIVYARNATRLNEILLPFEFPGSLNVSYQGFVTTGCRTSYFETQTYANYDLANRRAVIRLATSSLPLGPGSGPIAKLRFSIPFSVSSVDTAVIELDGYATYLPEFSGSRAQYQPRTVAGGISVSCCIGIRGNIDGSIGESIDVSDITYLVDYLFDQGEPPPCMDEANVDGITGPSGSVDIADLTYLVGYFFLSGLPPAGCS